MAVSFDTRGTAAPDVLVSDAGGESVLLNLKSEQYFGLDEVGTRMWHAVTGSPSLQAAYERLLAEYEVKPDVLRRDLSEWVEKLVEHGLLEVSGE